MKYFINGEEIKFGDKFFHVKEFTFSDIATTITYEGVFSKKNAKALIREGIVDYKICNEDSKEEDTDLIDQIDKNIEAIERIKDVLEKLIG